MTQITPRPREDIDFFSIFLDCRGVEKNLHEKSVFNTSGFFNKKNNLLS